MSNDLEFLARDLAAKLVRIEQAIARDRQLIHLSLERVALSEKLLEDSAPKVGHPESPARL